MSSEDTGRPKGKRLVSILFKEVGWLYAAVTGIKLELGFRVSASSVQSHNLGTKQ